MATRAEQELTVGQIKAMVRHRDAYKCRDCGREWSPPEKAFHVHRLIPGSKYSVDGCVTLCEPCHAKRHGWGYGCWRATLLMDRDWHARVRRQAERLGDIGVTAYIKIAVTRQLEEDEASDPTMHRGHKTPKPRKRD